MIGGVALAGVVIPAPAREADVNERTDTGTMDPHGRGDEIPALTTCVRFTPSRPNPAATTRTPPTFRLAWADPETAETGARRARLAQCEPSATKSTPARAVRSQRDGIHPRSILAIPPRTMRAQMTSLIRLPRGRHPAPPGTERDPRTGGQRIQAPRGERPGAAGARCRCAS